jgi:hypothetical protein
MRNDEKVVALHFAPTACVTIAKLDEIDRSLERTVKVVALDSILTHIDSYQRTWPDQWIHGAVGQTYVTSTGSVRWSIAHLVASWEQRSGLIANRHRQALKILCFCRNNLSGVRVRNPLAFFNLIDIDTVESHHIGSLHLVDRAEAEDLTDAWFRVAILQLR